MGNMKWYHIVAIALGLGAIVAIVYIVMKSTDIVARLSHDTRVEAIDV